MGRTLVKNIKKVCPISQMGQSPNEKRKEEKMNWYMQTGKDGDVVLNSKIQYSRNLRNYRFETKSLKEIQEIENIVKNNLASIGYNLKFLKLKDMDELTKKSLNEKGLIDEYSLNDNVSVLVNDEEKIRDELKKYE